MKYFQSLIISLLLSNFIFSQANLSIATPYPGTKFYDMAQKQEGGVRLLVDDWSQYKRYGQAVISVGDISAEELIKFQNYGFYKIYSAPWRWLPVLRKNGILGLFVTFYRCIKYLIHKYFVKFEIAPRHPALD